MMAGRRVTEIGSRTGEKFSFYCESVWLESSVGEQEVV